MFNEEVYRLVFKVTNVLFFQKLQSDSFIVCLSDHGKWGNTDFRHNSVNVCLVRERSLTNLEHLHTDRFISVDVGVTWHPVAVTPF